jgi:BirA family biotin operon repressor/biotin-[acetyl-CoA-carboxylase] ligase
MTTFRSENDLYSLHFKEIESTHEWLFERMGYFGTGSVTVVSADHQTLGKGQRGNRWISGKGQNLLISILLNDLSRPVTELWLLNALLTLTVCDLCRSAGLHNQRIKWPNDIYVDKQKISGVLTRNTIRNNLLGPAVLSVGVNINQQDFGPDLPGATSWKRITGQNYDLLVYRWLYISFFRARFIQYLQEPENMFSDFVDLLIGYKEFVPISYDGVQKEGKIENILPTGELIMRTEDGETITSSNIKFQLPHA